MSPWFALNWHVTGDYGPRSPEITAGDYGPRSPEITARDPRRLRPEITARDPPAPRLPLAPPRAGPARPASNARPASSLAPPGARHGTSTRPPVMVIQDPKAKLLSCDDPAAAQETTAGRVERARPSVGPHNSPPVLPGVWGGDSSWRPGAERARAARMRWGVALWPCAHRAHPPTQTPTPTPALRFGGRKMEQSMSVAPSPRESTRRCPSAAPAARARARGKIAVRAEPPVLSGPPRPALALGCWSRSDPARAGSFSGTRTLGRRADCRALLHGLK